MKSMIQGFFAGQVRICRKIDRRFFPAFAIDGNQCYLEYVLGDVPHGASVVEIGGGKTPIFGPGEVARRSLEVVGVDIDGDELAAAPQKAYVQTFVGPIEEVRGHAQQGYIIAQSVLEHVKDGALTAQGIASFAAPGAKVVTFCPCRRAVFAQLNLILPEVVKRAVLFFVFPAKRERQGFPAFYDGCTPAELERNMVAAGIETEEIRYFFVSSYFMFFVPVYLIWRLGTYPFMKLWPRRYCETFMYIGRKAGRSTG